MRGHGNYINILITMTTLDVLLRHFCKMSLTVGIRGCTLLSLMNSWCGPDPVLSWCFASTCTLCCVDFHLTSPLSTGGACKVELLEALDARVEYPTHFAEWDVGPCDAVYFLIQKE